MGGVGEEEEEEGEAAEEDVGDDALFWKHVAKRAAGNEEALGRGARGRAAPRNTLVDVSDSDLSDSDEEGGGGRKRRKKKRKKVVDDDDGSDGYELSLSDAEDELKRKKKVKKERGPPKDLCMQAVGKRVVAFGTGAMRGRSARGVYRDDGKVLLDAESVVLRKEMIRADAAKAAAAAAAAEAEAAEAAEAAEKEEAEEGGAAEKEAEEGGAAEKEAEEGGEAATAMETEVETARRRRLLRALRLRLRRRRRRMLR